MSVRRRDQLAGLLALLALFGSAVVGSLGFPPRARIYPLFVGGLGVLLGLVALLAFARTTPEEDAGTAELQAVESEGLAVAFRRIVPYLLWLLALFSLIRLVGLVLASGVFVAVFLRQEGRVGWPAALAGLVGVCGFLAGVGRLFGLHWPVSVIDPLGVLGVL